MSRRMTVVFDDEALYTALQVEAARREWQRCGGVEAGAFLRDLEAGQWCLPPSLALPRSKLQGREQA